MEKIAWVKGTPYTVQMVRDLISTSDAAAIRAMLRIFEYQTSYEAQAERTIETNHVGFNSSDGYMMTALAKFYMKYNRLTAKQLYRVRKSMPKYAGQIFNLMLKGK